MATQPIATREPKLAVADNSIRTFHSHGVAEVRAIILQDDKRVDVHIIDLDAVLRKAREQGHPVADVILGLVDLVELTEKHPDAHKLEITVNDLDGTGNRSQLRSKPRPEGVPGPDGDSQIDRDKR